ncbi:MAG: SPOR domain-containing protein [Planctomycetota bacterium]|jgi:hypothetical protein
MTRLRKIVSITLAIALCMLFLMILLPSLLISSRLSVKGGAYHRSAEPDGAATSPEPEAQFEDHTCGYHALRTVYDAYVLSPDEESLRVRLGVDVATLPWDSTTTGTLQPDLFRVLAEDGFKFESLDLSQPEAANRLLAHLEAKQLAMALIRRRENGNMHWVVIGPPQEGNLRIVDSLFPEPWFDSPDSFLSQCALSIVLISPNDSDSAISETQAHAAGLKEMRRSHARLKQINENAESEN